MSKDDVFKYLGWLVIGYLVVVAVFGIWLAAIASKDGFAALKDVYQLVVIDTLAESFVAIVAGFVAYTFGEFFAKVMNNRNLMIHDLEADKYPLDS